MSIWGIMLRGVMSPNTIREISAFILPSEAASQPEQIVLSARDIVAGSRCELGAVRWLDQLLGRPRSRFRPATAELAARLGDRREARTFQQLRAEFAMGRDAKGDGQSVLNPYR